MVPPVGKRRPGRPAGPRVEVGGGATGGRPHTSREAQRYQARALATEPQDGRAGHGKVPTASRSGLVKSAATPRGALTTPQSGQGQGVLQVCSSGDLPQHTFLSTLQNLFRLTLCSCTKEQLIAMKWAPR